MRNPISEDPQGFFLLINRLSFNSVKIFLFSLVNKCIKSQTIVNATTTWLSFFFDNGGIVVCSPILKLKVSNTFNIIRSILSPQWNSSKTRWELGVQSLKRNVIDRFLFLLLFLKISINVTDTKWNVVQS